MVNSTVDTLARYKILINIFISYKKGQEITISELAREINIAPSHPTYQEIYNFLIEQKCFIPMRQIGRNQLFMIKLNILEDIIRKSYPFLITSNFIKSSTVGYNF